MLAQWKGTSGRSQHWSTRENNVVTKIRQHFALNQGHALSLDVRSMCEYGTRHVQTWVGVFVLVLVLKK